MGSAIQMDHLDNRKKFNYSDNKIPSCNLKKIIVGYSNDDLSNGDTNVLDLVSKNTRVKV